MEKSQPTEAIIQYKIMSYLRKDFKEGLWFKIPQGAYSMIGISDILGCFYGHFVALEVKRSGKKLTKLQGWFQKSVQENGGTAETVCSVEETKEVLKNVRSRLGISEARLECRANKHQTETSEH